MPCASEVAVNPAFVCSGIRKQGMDMVWISGELEACMSIRALATIHERLSTH
jgi:hypothetical protein